MPGLIIDSCASGSRRNDLETMRRAIPLHKSDSPYSDHNKTQAMHWSLYPLFPYFGTMTAQAEDIHHADDYGVRSSYVSALAMMYDVRINEPGFIDSIRSYSEQWRRLSGYFYSEYCPLTA